MNEQLNVSIIIPAYNAAETIAATLQAVLDQTSPAWEAIVVDDNSTDETAAVVTALAQQDKRIRLVSQPHRGVSAARNTGIEQAQYDWLLFLDADDGILPPYLERMTAILRASPDLDAVHCGSTRIVRDGTWLEAEYEPESGDLFGTFARRSVFPIHACLVRRALVTTVGGFDTSLQMGEDWDLWQRISRVGAWFGALPEALALYRLRPHSASTDGFAMFSGCLQVLNRGHGPDPRVASPHPDHADGLPPTYLPRRRLYLSAWFAGIVIGAGADARPLLAAIYQDQEPELDATMIARYLFKSTLFPQSLGPADWPALWPSVVPRLVQFLAALEAQSGTLDLARQAQTHLEQQILDQVVSARPFALGTTYAIRLEVTEPITDILVPAPAEWVRADVTLAGEALGTVTVAVEQGCVPASTLADTVARHYAWVILGRFFARTIYPQLRREHGPVSESLWRGDLHLLNRPISEVDDWSGAHDAIGWTLFLQEIWGRPNWPKAYFYDGQIVETSSRQWYEAGQPLTVEVSGDIPDVETSDDQLQAVLCVASVPVGQAIIPTNHLVLAHQLRVTLTTASGYELCRVAVREALIGQPWMAMPLPTLRERLAARKRQQKEGLI